MREGEGKERDWSAMINRWWAGMMIRGKRNRKRTNISKGDEKEERGRS